MKANQELEKVYELIEQFDFEELTEVDHLLVFTVISKEEYVAMRSSILETQLYFGQANEPILEATTFVGVQRSNAVLRFLKQPIPLYKVAASILIIVGIYSTYQMVKPAQQERFASNQNTPTVQIRDTVFVNILDTLEIIKERIVYVKQSVPTLKDVEKTSVSQTAIDCDKEICPKDIDRLKNLACNNKIGNDTLLRQFLVSMN